MGILTHILGFSCGIVLCNRDAKFAVDCDTCRLSYCLVCLASGGKDPCVRCGHRPSKRMEQLVHLRLKSIYKAFKQSSTNSALPTSAVSVTGHHGATISTVEKHISRARGHRTKGWRERIISSDLQNASWDDDDDVEFVHDCPVIPSATDSKVFLDAGEAGLHSNSSDRMYRYKEEQEKADAAAAALLAELEEEEEAAKSRKKKKSKKKQRHQATSQGCEEAEDIQQDSYNRSLSVGNTPNTRHLESRLHDERKPVTQFNDDGSLNEDSAVQESMTPEEGMPSKDSSDKHEMELWNLVESSDVDGIERLLLSIKGVPGRALLRKNAKKALKRIRMEQEEDMAFEPEEEQYVEVVETDVGPVPDYVSTAFESSRELLAVVSETQVKSSASFVGTSRGRPAQANQSSGKCECVLSMSPLIVGWVIGKGGQRIRDLMEESGARIWIDQESVGPSENRVVYVSGQRKSVDDAVDMIKELVSKAPVSSTQSKHGAPVGSSHVVDLPTVVPNNDGSPLKGNSSQFPDGEVKQDPLRAKDGTDLSAKRFADEGSSTRHVMTCDPRYVPLLIGRRGWEIKSIQDRSNAQVDIDQTVTPRRITISGTKESVAKAVDLVQDVLSYPTSQLQGLPYEAGQTEQVEGGASPQPLQSYAECVATADEGKRTAWPGALPSQIDATPSLGILKNDPHTSPPSSLIMNADAKSTVSVSSSLSSTPEPTMSSAKSPYTQIFPLPSNNMLPPMNSRNGIGGSELKIGEASRVSLPQTDALHPYHAFPPSALPLGGAHFSQNGSQSSSIFDHRHHAATLAEVNNPLSLLQLEPRHGVSYQLHAPLHSSEARGFPLHDHSGLRSTEDLFDQTGIHGHQQELGRHETPSAGLWEHPVGAPGRVLQAAPAPVGSFQLDAAVDFLQNSNSQYNGRVAVGPPHAHIILAPPGTPAKEDSRIIDSMFATSGEPESSLLHGFDGLSMNRNDAPNSMFGLFATSDARAGTSNPRQSFGDRHPTTQEPDTFPSGFGWNR